MSKGIERVYVLGAGKLGRNLGRLLRRAGLRTTVRPWRRGWPARRIDADVVIVAVRDADIERAAQALGRAGLLGHRRKTVAVLHCAGALSAEVLASVRAARVAVGQMHPAVSFADPQRSPTVAGARVHLAGDAVAVRRAAELARLLGMSPRRLGELDRELVHAALALVANGTAALAAAGATLLEAARANPTDAAAILGPLLRSVADNVEQLGLPQALTGPVRRGDRSGIERHLTIIGRRCPELLGTYRSLVRAQLPMARALGEASEASLSAITTAVDQVDSRKTN